MKCLVLFAVLLGTTLASQCPEVPADVAGKQQRIAQIVEQINRPLIPVKVVPVDETRLQGLGILPRNEIFSLFDERNWPEARRAVEYLLEPQSFDNFIQAAKELSSRINDELFLYALSVAVLHRPDTRGVQVPRVQDVFPDKFIPNYVLQQIREAVIRGEQNPTVNYSTVSSNNLNVEERLNYFTADLGMNSHHYHYHVIHPATGVPLQNVIKDRHGSRFAWMHNQIVNRYEAERLSVNLPLTEPFENWDEEIQAGFSSHLTIFNKGYNYNFRPEGIRLSDLPELTRNQMRLWRSRILYGIDRRSLNAGNNRRVSLEQEDGTDILGNVVESSLQSINRPFYGNLHNYAHVIAGRASDPDGRYGAHNGVMHDVATSARDPLFYRWHKYIDSLFQEQKNRLRPYSQDQINWPQIELRDVTVVPVQRPYAVNQVRTYYSTSQFQLGEGFDFTRQSRATVNVRHLNHEPFEYRFNIYNNAQETQNAAVRVFLAPRYNEQGRLLEVNEQRRLLVELDKFVVQVQPGFSTIRRSSSESSVTMPTRYIYDDVSTLTGNHSCSCGWPEYLLLPRGTYEGLDFQLFVVFSNWNEDRVQEQVQQECQCSESLSYCGSLNGRYPDSRAFGYPFDRRVNVSSWREFVTPNIRYTNLNIRFVGDVTNVNQQQNQ